MALGADDYVNTSNPDELKAVENTLDYLVITITASVDWTPYLAAMRPNGAIAFVGAIADKPLEFPAFSLLMKNVSNISKFPMKMYITKVINLNIIMILMLISLFHNR